MWVRETATGQSTADGTDWAPYAARVPAEITPADLRASLSAKGVEEWEAGHFEQMYQLFRDGESEFVTGEVETMTGRVPRDVEDYLSEVFAGTAAEQSTVGSAP